MVDSNLSDLEVRVLRALIDAVGDSKFKEAFKVQMDKLCVKSRTEKTFGYYVDFFAGDICRADALIGDDFNLEPPCVVGHHPEVEGCIFFIVYVKDGVVSFLESSATDYWPKNEEKIILDAK